jgi:predicted nuclease of predicted toxin-antitoxin system
VKLLLDVHHSPRVAERLRASGHDVIAAADVSELAVLSDDELLRNATADDRAVVTENTRDFDHIVRSWATTGEHHAGVIFTSPRKFHRGSAGYPETLVVALRTFLATPPAAGLDWVHWLQ